MGSHIEEVYNAIYQKILDGSFVPGEKLHIAALAKMFGVGLSPVREALSRLIATDFVIAVSQRGFKVAPLSREDLNDIYTTRTYIEEIALTLSIEKGDENWEANLLAAFHRLSQMEKKTEVDSMENYKAWEKYHRAFNVALLAACGLKHLLSIQEKLYHQTERYRRIWFLAELKRNKVLQFSHRQKFIMDAALQRDAEKACRLLKEHFEQAQKLIANALDHKNR